MFEWSFAAFARLIKEWVTTGGNCASPNSFWTSQFSSDKFTIYIYSRPAFKQFSKSG